jgi:hypothetical protein
LGISNGAANARICVLSECILSLDFNMLVITDSFLFDLSIINLVNLFNNGLWLWVVVLDIPKADVLVNWFSRRV